MNVVEYGLIVKIRKIVRKEKIIISLIHIRKTFIIKKMGLLKYKIIKKKKNL